MAWNYQLCVFFSTSVWRLINLEVAEKTSKIFVSVEWILTSVSQGIFFFLFLCLSEVKSHSKEIMENNKIKIPKHKKFIFFAHTTNNWYRLTSTPFSCLLSLKLCLFTTSFNYKQEKKLHLRMVWGRYRKFVYRVVTDGRCLLPTVLLPDNFTT